MAAISRADNHQVAIKWQYKIADVDIEIKENQFINDQAAYYKAAKTKPKKTLTFDEKKSKRFRSSTKRN